MLVNIFRGIASGIHSGHRAVGRARRAFSLATCPDSIKPDLEGCYHQAETIRALIGQSCRDLSEDVWWLAETFEIIDGASYVEFMTIMALGLAEGQGEQACPSGNLGPLAAATNSFFESLSRLPPVWRQRVSAALDSDVYDLANRIDGAVLRLQSRQEQDEEYWDKPRP